MHQLRDEPALRVWGRGLVDLVAMIAAAGATDLLLWLPMAITIGLVLLLIVAGVVFGLAQLVAPIRRTVR